RRRNEFGAGGGRRASRRRLARDGGAGGARLGLLRGEPSRRRRSLRPAPWLGRGVSRMAGGGVFLDESVGGGLPSAPLAPLLRQLCRGADDLHVGRGGADQCSDRYGGGAFLLRALGARRRA